MKLEDVGLTSGALTVFAAGIVLRLLIDYYTHRRRPVVLPEDDDEHTAAHLRSRLPAGAQFVMIAHYTYFPTREALFDAATFFEGEGYEVQLAEGRGRKNRFIALLRRTTIPEQLPAHVRGLRKAVKILGGSYDLWVPDL